MYHTHKNLKVIVLVQSGACLLTRADNSFVYSLTSSSRFVEFRLLLITDDVTMSCLNDSMLIARKLFSLQDNVYLRVH